MRALCFAKVSKESINLRNFLKRLQFIWLSFELASVPRYLIRIMKSVTSSLTKTGERLLIRLYDIILLNQDPNKFIMDVSPVTSFLEYLGFVAKI